MQPEDHQNLEPVQENATPNISNCWKDIGVWGSHQCDKLEQVIHCRNCDVFTQAGRNLLERELPPEYMQEWSNVLASKKQQTLIGSLSVLIFRVEGEWLALSSLLFAEVVDPGPMHSLPHRPSPVLLGLVNVHGEVQICVSFQALLGIDKLEVAVSQRTPKRMLVVKDGQQKVWVFPVDEILGVHRIHPDNIENPPATVRQPAGGLSKGVFDWDTQRVALLDSEALLDKLRGSLQ